MNIRVKEREPREWIFEDILCGTVFATEHTILNEPLIKVDDSYDKAGVKFNAVYLDDGVRCCINNNCVVIPLDAELSVREK